MESSGTPPTPADDSPAFPCPEQEGTAIGGTPALEPTVELRLDGGGGPLVEEADPSERRRAELMPFFDDFVRWAATELDPAEVPHFVELRGWPIELGSWERETLRERADSEPSGALLAEGVAFQVKCYEISDRFERGPMPPPDELPAFLDHLVMTVATGSALAHELQGNMNRQIAAGRLADAKSLSGFRNRIVQCLSQLQERVGATELEAAERLAAQLVGPSETASSTPASRARARLLEEEEPEAPDWATYGGRKPERQKELPPWLTEGAAQATAEPEAPTLEPRGRIKSLLLLLAALIVVYGIVMMPRATREPGPSRLTKRHFAHLEAVQGVRARPPSLYITLDAEAWQAGTTEERQQLLAAIGRIAAGAGYVGIHARTTDGVTVGQWLEKTGVRLTGRPAESS